LPFPPRTTTAHLARGISLRAFCYDVIGSFRMFQMSSIARVNDCWL
jgi:hypothetical protein